MLHTFLQLNLRPIFISFSIFSFIWLIVFVDAGHHPSPPLRVPNSLRYTYSWPIKAMFDIVHFAGQRKGPFVECRRRRLRRHMKSRSFSMLLLFCLVQPAPNGMAKNNYNNYISGVMRTIRNGGTRTTCEHTPHVTYSYAHTHIHHIYRLVTHASHIHTHHTIILKVNCVKCNYVGGDNVSH